MVAWIKEHKEVLAIAVPIVGILVAILIYVLSLIPVWYQDNDQDEFGNPEVSKISLWRPPGFVRNGNDCYDSNSEARPNAERYFATHRGDGSFDYDCSGTSTQEQTVVGSCSNGTANEGWDGEVPPCGKTGKWLVDCDRKPLQFRTVRETKNKVQNCR